MLALIERYRGTCSCCDAAGAIADGWMDGAASAAGGLNAPWAVYLAGRAVADAVQHRMTKRCAKSRGVEFHRESYHVALELWCATQAQPAEHKIYRHRLLDTAGQDGRCPLAMLALAALFGRGNFSEGAAKAVAAILANQSSAVQKIKGLI